MICAPETLSSGNCIFLKNLLRKFCGLRMHAHDATHGMQFTNETLHCVVLFAVPIRDERTDGDGRSSVTTATRTSVAFVCHSPSSGVAQACARTARTAIHPRSTHARVCRCAKTHSFSPTKPCYHFWVFTFPISRSQPWNGPHRSTKRSISIAKSARTLTPNSSLEIDFLRPRFRRG